ncbi:MAG: CoA-binding protein [Candidatus Krumholzibacteria bacterium]|nr:CoA-binding protein [Candidatus Krumholzibacteria bacterium]MDH4337073.1 CoA-binding protein [Candidatus Krumholzibacteria bacterium]MDH5268610.1 CoA-binding protein [Candidatus Krumholzibacteria bacterium]
MNVAVIGASSNRNKFGNKAVRSYRAHGHSVYPVNPGEAAIEGLPAFKSIEDIPADIDVTLVYLPPAVTLTVLTGIARKGTRQLYLNPGSENDTVVARARELGLEPILACSIMAIGDSPSHYS